MNQMKICLISLKIAPDCERTGFEGIYNYLKNEGYDVKLLTGKWNYVLNDPNIIQMNLVKKRFLWMPHFIYNINKYLNRNSFDIIHGNGPKSSIPILFSNYKRFISTIHDLGPFETKFATQSLQKFLIKYIIKKATYITTVSNHTREGLKKFIPSINSKNIHILYNGIDNKFKPYPKDAEKLKKQLKIKGPIILYLGRIAKYKGVEHIIKAYKIAKKTISNLNLIIAGKPDFEMENIYNTWREKNLDIHFLGFISDELVPIYYTMADILIAYSYGSEGFGNTPLESLACGTAVLCSNLKVYREILHDRAIFIPPKNPKILAEKIILVIKDEELRKELIKQGQEIAKKYTWDKVGKRLVDVYQKFLSET